MPLNAFQPQGNTVLVAASSSTGLAATQYSTQAGVFGVMVTNPSTVTIYAVFGSSSVAASQPSTSAPASMPFPGGSQRPLNLTAPISLAWCSAVTSAGAAAPGLFITPGFGQ